MTDKEKKHWYVLRAIFRKEVKVRDKLRLAGFHCYVPMCYRVETVKGRKVRRLVPAITELVFVYANEESISDFKLHSKDTIYWLTKPNGDQREKIVVPDKAMEDFIRVTQEKEQSITYFRPEEINLNAGDRILIHGGAFDGVEGVMLKFNHKRAKQLVVSIPGIIMAAVSIRPEVLELVSRKRTKSTNPTRDIRELIHLATQMLTSPPDRIEQSAEWDMMHFEIQRLYESISPLHAYLPALKGEMALSILMAEVVLQQRITPETRQRFIDALGCLGDHTQLKVRMQLIGGTLLTDTTLLSQAHQTLSLWKTAPTDRQRAILSEAALFSHGF